MPTNILRAINAFSDAEIGLMIETRRDMCARHPGHASGPAVARQTGRLICILAKRRNGELAAPLVATPVPDWPDEPKRIHNA